MWRIQGVSDLLLLKKNAGEWSKNSSCEKSKRSRCLVPNTQIQGGHKVGLTMTGRVGQEDVMTERPALWQEGSETKLGYKHRGMLSHYSTELSLWM